MWRTPVVAMLLVAMSACASAWQLEHPFLYGGEIRAMETAGSVAVAVGPRGTVLRSRDAGRTWGTIASGIVEDLHGIARDGELWVAVGDRGTVLRSRDGASFERRPAPTSESLVAVAVAGRSVIAVAESGAFLRSQDGAESFESLPGIRADLAKLSSLDAGSVGVRATSIVIDSSGVFVGTDLGLWRSTDHGARFLRITTEPIQAISVAPDGTLYALGGEFVIYSPREICNTCLNAGYETVGLYRSRNGVTWKRRAIRDPTRFAGGWEMAKRPTPPARPPRSAMPFRADQGFYSPRWEAPVSPRSLAIGPHGELFVGANRRYLSTNGGDSFRETTGRDAVLWAGTGTVVDSSAMGGRRVPSERLSAITTTAEGGVYAVGQAGAMLVRTPSRWRKLATPAPTAELLAVDEWRDCIVAVGRGGMILESHNGETFERRESHRSSDLTVVWFAGPDVFAAGRGTFLRSRNRGQSWESTTTTLATPTALWGSAPFDLYLLDGGIHHSVDFGETWADLAKPEGQYRAIWGFGPELFIVGAAGKLARSRDGGETWSTLASGTTMDLRAVWGDEDDVYIAGGDTAGGCVVMRSRDRGASWRKEPVRCQEPVDAIDGTASHVWILSGSRDRGPSSIWRGEQ